MSKNSLNLFFGILFCLSITALIIACLAFTKKISPDFKPPTMEQSNWQNPRAWLLPAKPDLPPRFMCKGQGVDENVVVGTGSMATKGGGLCDHNPRGCKIFDIPAWWSAAGGFTDEQRIILNKCAKSVEGVVDCKACANAWSLLQEKKPWRNNLECANASYGSSSPCDPENYYPYTDGSEFVNTCSWCSNPGAWTPPVPCNPSGDCENCGDCCSADYGCTDFSPGIDLPREAVKAFCNSTYGKYCGT